MMSHPPAGGAAITTPTRLRAATWALNPGCVCFVGETAAGIAGHARTVVGDWMAVLIRINVMDYSAAIAGTALSPAESRWYG
jgi:hypothetical protein